MIAINGSVWAKCPIRDEPCYGIVMNARSSDAATTRQPAPPPFEVLTTLFLAALGGGGAFLLGMPLPWLIGPMLVVALWTLSGRAAPLPDRLRLLAFLVVGISIGAGVTPETVRGFATWPLSLLGLILTVPLIVGAATLYLGRLGWDRRTAILSSIPGALSAVLAIAMETGADVRRVAIVQSTRLVALIVLIPSLITLFGDTDVDTSMGMAVAVPLTDPAYWGEIAILVPASVVGGILLQRLRIPGGILFGAMIVSAVLHGGGWITYNLPAAALIPGMALVGAAIGGRFAGAGFADLAATGGHALVSLGLTLAVALGIALVVAEMLGLPFGQVLLAYAPGGLEAMTIMAFALDLDPAFVAAHQVLRFLGIGLVLPFLFARLKG
ncbi:MAG: AbrB family transcriptional regulator [Pseudomonadota bacterium]